MKSWILMLVLPLLFATGCITAGTATKAIEGAVALGSAAGDIVVKIDAAKIANFEAEIRANPTVETVRRVEAASNKWKQDLEKIKGALRAYATAITTASSTFLLVLAGVDKKLTFAMVVSELASAGKALMDTLSAFGVTLPIGGK